MTPRHKDAFPCTAEIRLLMTVQQCNVIVENDGLLQASKQASVIMRFLKMSLTQNLYKSLRRFFHNKKPGEIFLFYSSLHMKKRLGAFIACVVCNAYVALAENQRRRLETL